MASSIFSAVFLTSVRAMKRPKASWIRRDNLEFVNINLAKMKLRFLSLVLLLAGQNLAMAQSREDFANGITAEGIKKHLMILASDAFEGRETGKPGQKKAAEYIANHFNTIGLADPTQNQAQPYYQPVPLIKQSWGKFTIHRGQDTLHLMEDFYAIGGFQIPAQPLELVFAGYGLESDTYSDYDGLDINGKVVVLINDAPSKAIADKLGDGLSQREMNSPYFKISTALSKGAALVLLCHEKAKTVNANIKNYGDYINRPSLTFEGDELKEKGGIISSFEAVAKLTGFSFKKLNKKIKKYAKIAKTSIVKINMMVNVTAERQSEDLPTENILGYLEGSSKKEEVLVITAHYDHIGINDDGAINNGADDDGSGISSLLEIARAFVKAKEAGFRPERSILFMTVTGEEKGLLGSGYYTDHPIFPLENTITNLNIDMIGRIDQEHANDTNYVYVIGSDMLSSELHLLSESVQKQYANHIKLDYRYNDKDDPNRFYYRSDHYNFAKHDIPVIFYFTGVHPDYHKPTDTPDKILYEKTAEIAKLIFHTAWELANRDTRPTVDKPTKN